MYFELLRWYVVQMVCSKVILILKPKTRIAIDSRNWIRKEAGEQLIKACLNMTLKGEKCPEPK